MPGTKFLVVGRPNFASRARRQAGLGAFVIRMPLPIPVPTVFTRTRGLGLDILSSLNSAETSVANTIENALPTCLGGQVSTQDQLGSVQGANRQAIITAATNPQTGQVNTDLANSEIQQMLRETNAVAAQAQAAASSGAPGPPGPGSSIPLWVWIALGAGAAVLAIKLTEKL